MLRIPENVLNFSDNVDLFEAWKDYFNHYRAVKYDKKGLEYDTKLNFNEKTQKLNKAIQSEVNRFAGVATDSVINDKALATNPNYRWAGYAVVSALIDAVIPDIIADAYGRFSEVRNIGFGDSQVFDIESNDLFTVSKNGNSRRHVNAQKMFTGQQALIPENRSITVQTDLYRVLAGKENLADFAAKAALSVEAEIAKDIYTALSDSYDDLSANFKETGFTKQAFQKLRNRVSAANGGAATYVYGTDIALSEILPESDYLKMELGQEYNTIGYLPVYMNTGLIALPQKIDWSTEDYDFLVEDDELFFISSNSQSLVKIVTEGQTLTVNDTGFANANLTEEVTIHQRWKVGVVSNSKYGMLKLGE